MLFPKQLRLILEEEIAAEREHPIAPIMVLTHEEVGALLDIVEAAQAWKKAHGVVYLPPDPNIPRVPGDAFTTPAMADSSNELARVLEALQGSS